MTINYSCQIAEKVKPGDYLQNFVWLCGSPPSPAVQEEKEGTEKLNYLCQSSFPVPVLHLSYHGAVLGLMIRRYLEVGKRRREAEAIWCLDEERRHRAQLALNFGGTYP